MKCRKPSDVDLDAIQDGKDLGGPLLAHDGLGHHEQHEAGCLEMILISKCNEETPLDMIKVTMGAVDVLEGGQLHALADDVQLRTSCW